MTGLIKSLHMQKSGFYSLRQLKRAGVRVCGTEIYVERGAVIDGGAELYAPCYISAASHVCKGAAILPFCHLDKAYVGVNAVVRASTIVNSEVDLNAKVGPYAYLREGAKICENCRIGSFVEVKASVIGKNSKIAHLAYVGDAEVGCGVNIGCGVVFANYDGKVKRKIVVGDGCFIGCNCNLIAPLNIEKGAYIAAGTTLTKDLKENDFCIGRSREKVKPRGGAGRYTGG